MIQMEYQSDCITSVGVHILAAAEWLPRTPNPMILQLMDRLSVNGINVPGWVRYGCVSSRTWHLLQQVILNVTTLNGNPSQALSHGHIRRRAEPIAMLRRPLRVGLRHRMFAERVETF